MSVGTVTHTSVSDSRRVVAEWFTQYETPLFRYLVRLTGDEEGSADLLQDTFIHALRAVERGTEPSIPSAWLFRIATNLAYNSLRRRRRFRWLPLHGSEPAPPFEADVTLAQSVRDCLTRLTPREAEALLLHEYAGLTSIEIAALNGETASAVRVRLSRAYARFAALYEKESE